LKLKCDEPLSRFACFGFNCKLRHYTQEAADAHPDAHLYLLVRGECLVGRCSLTPG